MTPKTKAPDDTFLDAMTTPESTSASSSSLPVEDAKAHFSDHVKQMRDRARSAVRAVRTAAVFGDGDTGMERVDAVIDALALEADTNATLYSAWRKRAEEAEAVSAPLLAEIGDLRATLATWRQSAGESVDLRRRAEIAESALAEAQGEIAALTGRISWLEGTAMPHARKQENASGFQAGWHAALSRVEGGDSIAELRESLPSPPDAAASPLKETNNG